MKERAVVVVAVRAAAREISKTAVLWALTHVVQHGDTILLLALNPPRTSSGSYSSFSCHYSFRTKCSTPPSALCFKGKLWGFPLSCASAHKAVLNQTSDVSDLCSQMMLKLRDVYDPTKVCPLSLSPNHTNLPAGLILYLPLTSQVNVKVKVLSASPSGCVATESKTAQASWVVLDK
jgi:hypothetical protein